MRPELLLVALLVAAPAAYAWWSGRKIRRSLDDPALAELMQARQRRMAQVTGFATMVSVFSVGPLVAFLALLGLLVAQYPIRRAVFGDEWSLPTYVAYSIASSIATAGFLMLALLGPTLTARLVRAWMPGATLASYALAFAGGALCAIVVLVWNRWFTTIWLWLQRGSPLEHDTAHAALLPRLDTVLDRAADRLSRRPSIHRFGWKGGRIANAFALPSLRAPAVAISDTLLDSLDADETTAIFAHEVAHHEYFNAARLETRRRGFFVVALLVTILPAVLIVTGPESDVIASIAFLFVLASLVLRGQAPKQQQETASDLRAVELTNDPEALIRALTKLHLLARQPRRWAKEVEHAATHPSLARRIQAIRAHTPVASATPDTPVVDAPTVVAAKTAGSFVVLGHERAYWIDGVPAGTPADLVSLRERASSYRALTYPELSELRLVAAPGRRTLHASDLAGRSWVVDVRDADVARIQDALDAVDTRLGTKTVAASVRSERAARILAAALLIAALLGGGTMVVAIPALATMLAPSTTSLAAMGAMGTASLLLLGTSGTFGLPHDTTSVLLVAALGLAAAWLAWMWHHARRQPLAANERFAARAMFALLGVGAIGTLVLVSTSWTTLRDLAGDENALSLAVDLCGLGAALLVLRERTLRIAGAATALFGVATLGVVVLGERLSPAASEIRWEDGRLSFVATVPLPNEMDAVTLSPDGTRWLTRRSLGNGDDENYTLQFTTGGVVRSAEPYTLKAIDAALPNETDMLVLASTDDDSLELRLERVQADSARRVVWRRTFDRLFTPTLRLLDGGTRWQVSGMRIGDRSTGALVTIDGAVAAGREADPHRSEFHPDTLLGQQVFAYRDGSRLVMSLARNPMLAMRGRSMLWTTLAALRGMNVTWQVSRQDREGVHPLASLHGYVQCWPATEDDVAACVDQGRRGVHVLGIARTGGIVDLGTLSRRFDRATGSPQGQIVASSFRDRSLAVVDVARRRGLRLVLPEGNIGFTRDATATSNALAVVMTGEGGSRLMVYRLGPLVETASTPEGTPTRSRR